MPNVAQKLCIKCKQHKAASEFHKDSRRPDGLFPYCKRCRAKDPEFYDEQRLQTAKGLRRCCSCKQWLQPDQFYIAPSRKGGMLERCIECAKAQAKRSSSKPGFYTRQYRRNPAKHNTRWHGFYQRNIERQRERVYQYRKTDAGKAMQARANHRRRIQTTSVSNTLTVQEWLAILEQQQYCCAACGEAFSDLLPPTRDHIVPVSKGGGLTAENTQALCKPCNSRKFTKHINYGADQHNKHDE